MSFAVQDALMALTLALPNGAATTVSTSLDLQNSSKGDFVAPCEVQISAPLLGATPLPDAKTMKYDLITSDSSDLSGPTVLVAAAITQTGASSSGAAADSVKLRLPSNVKRYLGFRATGSASGNASSASATLKLLF